MAFGTSRSVAAAAAVIAAIGCKSGSSPTPEPPTLQVYGTDIGATWANVKVLRGGTGAADARVVVNGAVLEPSAREPGLYSAQLPAQLAPGDAVSLEVTSGELRVCGSGRRARSSSGRPSPPSSPSTAWRARAGRARCRQTGDAVRTPRVAPSGGEAQRAPLG
jgi:hypothetical protein